MCLSVGMFSVTNMVYYVMEVIDYSDIQEYAAVHCKSQSLKLCFDTYPQFDKWVPEVFADIFCSLYSVHQTVMVTC